MAKIAEIVEGTLIINLSTVKWDESIKIDIMNIDIIEKRLETLVGPIKLNVIEFSTL